MPAAAPIVGTLLALRVLRSRLAISPTLTLAISLAISLAITVVITVVVSLAVTVGWPFVGIRMAARPIAIRRVVTVRMAVWSAVWRRVAVWVAVWV